MLLLQAISRKPRTSFRTIQKTRLRVLGLGGNAGLQNLGHPQRHQRNNLVGVAEPGAGHQRGEHGHPHQVVRADVAEPSKSRMGGHGLISLVGIMPQ